MKTEQSLVAPYVNQVIFLIHQVRCNVLHVQLENTKMKLVCRFACHVCLVGIKTKLAKQNVKIVRTDGFKI